MALTGWNVHKRYGIEIDHNNVSDILSDFPVLLNISSSAGANSFDCSDLFTELNYPVIPSITTPDDTFTDTDGAAPDVAKWTLYNYGAESPDVTISGGALRFNLGNTTTYNMYATSLYTLEGDFDIQVEYSYIYKTDTDYNLTCLRVDAADGSLTSLIINRLYRVSDGGDVYLASVVTAGTNDVSDQTAVTTDTSGKMRLARTGTVVTLYYWNGVSWAQLNTYSSWNTSSVKVSLRAATYTNAQTYIVNFDNFTINSGTLQWPQLLDTFTGADGEYPDADRWLTTELSGFNLTKQNNKLYYSASSVPSDSYSFIRSIYTVSGDFDIQVDFDSYTASSYNNIGVELMAQHLDTVNGNDLMYIKAGYYAGDAFIWNSMVNGSWVGQSYASRNYSYGKLRLVRSGSTITAKTSAGGGDWITRVSRTVCSDNVNITLGIWAPAGAYNVSCNLDNLTVNTGTIVWPAATYPYRKKVALEYAGYDDHYIGPTLQQAPTSQQCYLEIENWDQLNGKAQLWAKIPEIASLVNTKLYLYYDINAPTTRSGVSSTFNTTDWTANRDFWRNSYNTATTTISGTYMTVACSAAYSEVGTLISNFGLSGDFDIQVDVYSLDTASRPRLYYWHDIDNRGYVGYDISTDNWIANSNVGGSWSADLTAAASGTNTYGALRLIRSGSTVYFKYKDGSSVWTDLGSYTAIESEVSIVLYSDMNVSIMSESFCMFNNLTINSSDIVSGYIGDAESAPAKAVWDDNFIAVYHMAQEPDLGTDCILTSTFDKNHATPVGTWTTSNLVDGNTSKALSFAGSNQYLELNELASSMVGKPLTIDVSVLPNTTQPSSNILRFFAINTNTGGNRILFGGDMNDMGFETYDGTTNWNSTNNTLDLVDYNNVSYTYDINTDEVTLFIDGQEDTSAGFPATAAHVSVTSSDLVSIGQEFDGGPVTSDFFAGKIQEVRVSNTIRPDAWRSVTASTLQDNLLLYRPAISIYFSSASPNNEVTYGATSPLGINVTVTGTHATYICDVLFYDSFDTQVGSTVSGVANGARATSVLSTPSGIAYSWYVVATTSGTNSTSTTYTFTNRFFASGSVVSNGIPVSGTLVRLYRRSDGSLVGESYTTSSGTFNIDTPYTEDHYCVALHSSATYNALIYDRLQP